MISSPRTDIARSVSRADYRWRLNHYLLPYFKDHSLPEISVAEGDRYRAQTLAIAG